MLPLRGHDVAIPFRAIEIYQTGCFDCRVDRDFVGPKLKRSAFRETQQASSNPLTLQRWLHTKLPEHGDCRLVVPLRPRRGALGSNNKNRSNELLVKRGRVAFSPLTAATRLFDVLIGSFVREPLCRQACVGAMQKGRDRIEDLTLFNPSNEHRAAGTRPPTRMASQREQLDIRRTRQTTMLGTAIRLGLPLWLATACMRPSDVAPLPEAKPSPGCYDGARREQVCRELGEARLLLGKGTAPLALDECAPNSWGAVVHWRRTDGEPFDYRGVVRFDWQAPRKRLTPVEIAPLQREWPTTAQQSQSEIARVLVPVGKPCQGPSDERTWLELPLPGPSATACASGPWLRGSQKLWCTQELTTASEVYSIYDFGWLRGRQTWRVAVAPTTVLISRGPDRKTITDPATVSQLKAQLSELWTLEPWLEEHCRDGGETVVEALSRTGWRSITRNCSDPAGVIRMLKALTPSDSTLTETHPQH